MRSRHFFPQPGAAGPRSPGRLLTRFSTVHLRGQRTDPLHCPPLTLATPFSSRPAQPYRCLRGGKDFSHRSSLNLHKGSPFPVFEVQSAPERELRPDALPAAHTLEGAAPPVAPAPPRLRHSSLLLVLSPGRAGQRSNRGRGRE